MNESLSDILDGVRRRAPAAVETLVERFGASAQSLARAIVSDEHAAEDVVQNAFLVAFARLDQLRDDAAFPAWFRQIVRSEAHRITRRRHAETSPEFACAVSNADPAREVETEELCAVVRAAAARLTTANTQVVELYYLRQLSETEVANRLHLPKGTVRRRLHDARRHLRAMLLGYIGEDQPPTPDDSRRETWPL